MRIIWDYYDITETGQDHFTWGITVGCRARDAPAMNSVQSNCVVLEVVPKQGRLLCFYLLYGTS